MAPGRGLRRRRAVTGAGRRPARAPLPRPQPPDLLPRQRRRPRRPGRRDAGARLAAALPRPPPVRRRAAAPGRLPGGRGRLRGRARRRRPRLTARPGLAAFAGACGSPVARGRGDLPPMPSLGCSGNCVTKRAASWSARGPRTRRPKSRNCVCVPFPGRFIPPDAHAHDGGRSAAVRPRQQRHRAAASGSGRRRDPAGGRRRLDGGGAALRRRRTGSGAGSASADPAGPGRGGTARRTCTGLTYRAQPDARRFTDPVSETRS